MWRKVRGVDVAEMDLIDANRDFLSACPMTLRFPRYVAAHMFPGTFEG